MLGATPERATFEAEEHVLDEHELLSCALQGSDRALGISFDDSVLVRVELSLRFFDELAELSGGSQELL